jgi:hypothetical protein
MIKPFAFILFCGCVWAQQVSPPFSNGNGAGNTPNIPVAATNSSGVITQATSANLAAAGIVQNNGFAFPSVYNAFGDSITAGTGCSPSSDCYVPLIATQQRLTVNNQAAGGATIADQMVPILATSITPSSFSSLLIGQNESSYTAGATIGNTANQIQYQNAVTAAALWLSIPNTTPSGNTQKVLAQAATKTGTWTNVSEYGGAMGSKSTTIGDTLTASVPGSAIYVLQLTRSTSTVPCTLSVAVDGGSAANYSQAMTYVSGNGSFTYIAQAIRITGLNTYAQHSVVVTDIAPGTNGCEILAVLGNGGAVSGTGPFFFLATPYHTNQGQPYTYSAQAVICQTIVSTLASDSLGIQLADVSSNLNLAVDPSLAYDTIHPNNAGHAIIASTFLASMQAWSVSQVSIVQLLLNGNPVFYGHPIFSNGATVSGVGLTVGTSLGSLGYGDISASRSSTQGALYLGSDGTASVFRNGNTLQFNEPNVSFAGNSIFNGGALLNGSAFYFHTSGGAGTSFLSPNYNGTAIQVGGSAIEPYTDGGQSLGVPGQGFSLLAIDPVITTLTGTSGAAQCSMAFQGTLKTAICYLNAYQETGAAQTYSFPTAFSTTPVIQESGGSCGTYNPTTTASTLTLPANAAMTAETCNVVLIGQ